MNRPKDSQKPANATAAPAKADEEGVFSLGTLYLLFYNWVSAVLWAALLGRVILALVNDDYTHVYERAGFFAKWTQTLAAMEVLHSLFRIVRAPVTTTLMQVASRFLLVWIIVDKFPALAVSSPAYTTMLLAWSVTEVIRYSYFTATLAYGGAAPDWLKWLRYNTFLVLYPLGIGSEVWMVCLACEPARKVHPFFERCCYGVLAFYAPGAYVLFTHMLAQRKKVMRQLGKPKTR